MKLRSLSVSLVIAVLCVTATPATSRAEEKETPLSQQMEVVDDAYKGLRTELKEPAPDKAKASEFVATMKAAAEKSKDMEPAKTASLPEGERAKFLAAYKQSMTEFLTNIEKLEKACEGGNWDEARAVMDTLRKAKSAGHKEFKSEDK